MRLDSVGTGRFVGMAAFMTEIRLRGDDWQAIPHLPFQSAQHPEIPRQNVPPQDSARFDPIIHELHLVHRRIDSLQLVKMIENQGPTIHRDGLRQEFRMVVDEPLNTNAN
ncbi:MAG: hypothetical protein JHC69_13305 [Akkermansiaceae bacterium]|nr:hypothetical protein [Akkermansiaceae bacterium]